MTRTRRLASVPARTALGLTLGPILGIGLLAGCGDATADGTADGNATDPGAAATATYALPDADWCDGLDLDAVAATLGLDSLRMTTDYPAPPPELSGDRGLQCVYAGGESALPDPVPDDVPGLTGAPADGAAGSAGTRAAVHVVVDLSLAAAGQAPDLAAARAFYAATPDGVLDPRTGDVQGWWDDGTQGSAGLAVPGEDRPTGYRTGTTVVDDNLTVDVSISADPLPDGTDTASLDAGRDQLLDEVHAQLVRA